MQQIYKEDKMPNEWRESTAVLIHAREMYD